MKALKKLSAIILTLSLFLCPLAASAQGIPNEVYSTASVHYFTGVSEPSTVSEQAAVNEDRYDGLTQAQIDKFRNQVATALANMETEIDVSEFGFRYEKEIIGGVTHHYVDQTLVDLFSEVIAEYPYLFHTNDLFGTKGYSDLRIATINPMYTVSNMEEYSAQIKYCKDEIEKLLFRISDDFSASEKVMYVQDYLTVEFEYDTRLYSDDPLERNKVIYDMYGFLVERRGVCQSYTTLFKAIMERLDVECECVIDRPNNHIWNTVKVDGEWYHLDATHDDPIFYDEATDFVYNFKGVVMRSCILLNDEEIAQYQKHDQWHTPLTLSDIHCTSTRFSNAAFRMIDTPISYYNGYWYGADDTLPVTTVYKFSRDFQSYEVLYSLDDGYTGNLNGIKGSMLVGNRLYVNFMKHIVEINLDTEEAKTVYTAQPDNIINTIYYYGGSYIGVTENWDYTNSADIKFRLPVGDLDGDGIIGATDMPPVINHILGIYDSRYSTALADVTADGKTDLVDLVRIKRHMIGQYEIA